MNTKMKGLLKGLRYISQIFEAKDEDENEEDDEMQIGFPTDVKHVAHIGWDDRAVTTPSWMNEFQSAPLTDSGSEHKAENNSKPKRSHSHDLKQMERENQDQANTSVEQRASSPIREQTDRNLTDLALPRPSRRQSKNGIASPQLNPSLEPAAARHSRRNKSSESISTESLDGSNHRRARRHSRLRDLEGGSETTGQDLPRILKPIRRKKKSSRSASEDGSYRSPQSKALNGYSDDLGRLDEEVTSGGLPPLRPIVENQRQ